MRESLLSQLQLLRAGRTTAANRLTPLLEHLETALGLLERQCAADPTVQPELDGWRRVMKQKLPSGSTFTGRAAYYTHSDAQRIKKHLFAACPYAALRNEGLQYLVAVRCVGFFGGVCCVWVYFGVVDTSLLQ